MEDVYIYVGNPFCEGLKLKNQITYQLITVTETTCDLADPPYINNEKTTDYCFTLNRLDSLWRTRSMALILNY